MGDWDKTRRRPSSVTSKFEQFKASDDASETLTVIDVRHFDQYCLSRSQYNWAGAWPFLCLGILRFALGEADDDSHYDLWKLLCCCLFGEAAGLFGAWPRPQMFRLFRPC